MAGFPQTPYFIGLNEPVGQEVAFTGLEVQGTIPAEIRGSFYRAVPDPAFPPKFADDHTLSADGMVSRLSINPDGSVDFAMKFVETARHKAEKALVFAQTYAALRRRIAAFVELPFDSLSRMSLQSRVDAIGTDTETKA